MGKSDQMSRQTQELEALRKQNACHPEMKDDERFLCNCELEGFGSIPYATKRHGIVANDASGNPVPNLFPVFVKRIEFEKASAAM